MRDWVPRYLVLCGLVPYGSILGLGPVEVCYVGPGPLLISGAGSPFNHWGWVPFLSMGLGPLAIDWREDLLQIPRSLEHPSAFYGAQHVWFCPTADQDLRGWVPFHYMELDPPSILRGCVPFQSEGLGPLLFNGAGTPFILWD